MNRSYRAPHAARRRAGRAADLRAFPARVTALVAVLLLVSGSAAPLAAQAEHRAVLAEKFRAELETIAAETPGVMGVAVVDLAGGERYGVHEELVFPQGSAIKIPVLVELYRQADAGRLDLAERLPVRAADQVGGSGVIRHFDDGTSHLSLRDLAVLMIVLSDNTATNLLIERVGMERVNRTMRELDVPGIRLQRLMIRPEASARGDENLATPREAAELMARIHRCELPVRAPRCAELRRILEIPKRGALPAPLPERLRVAWKPGGITGVGTAWGIVDLPGRPYAIAVMVNYSDGGAPDAAIERVSAATYAYFARLAGATPHGTRVAPELLPGGPQRPERDPSSPR